MIDPALKAVEFVQSVGAAVLKVKPEANQYEIIGTVYLILNKTIETLKNEQIQTRSPIEGETGTGDEPEQVQGTGTLRRIEESSEGLRSEQDSTTKSNRKKRRSKKSL